MTSRCYFGKMNSILGSVVPLAMFLCVDINILLQCMPLYTLLLAMGNPTVHHFSLDVEGAEFPILKTIPWDKVVKKNCYEENVSN